MPPKRTYIRRVNIYDPVTGDQICKDCEIPKSADHYYDRPTASRKHVYCKECVKARRWEQQYGITRVIYEELLEQQNGVCAICKQPETRLLYGKVCELSVDHCHETNVIRGLLCNMCNPGIGYFRNSPELLQAAIDYLNLIFATAP